MSSPSALFTGLLGLNWVLYGWDTLLNWRQYQVHLRNEKRPVAVKDIITEDAYDKARAYKLEKHRFNFVMGFFSRVESTLVLVYGLLPFLWNFSARFPMSSIIITLPFDLYDTFVIEQKHGFNKQTLGFYFTDQLKKLALSYALATPLILAVEWIVANGGPYFFVYVWLFMSIVMFALMTIYPEFIAPLFDKYIPLPDGNLKVAIEKLAASLKYPLTKLYVVHGSKRSSHSNAYMYGFWKNKRIVLYDTLLSGEELEKVVKECGVDEEERQKILAEDRGMQPAEVVAVLGHELGHWHHGHTLTNLIIVELNLLIMLAVFAYFYKWELLYRAFGFNTEPILIGLMLVTQYVLSMYNQVLEVAMNVLTRRFEFQADLFAVELGYGKELINALTKLGKDNLSLPVDDHLYSMCNHSHPPIPERSAAIQAAMKAKKE
ncbi:unnamed protein product, partial [Mesorhabditis spiculigera]